MFLEVNRRFLKVHAPVAIEGGVVSFFMHIASPTLRGNSLSSLHKALTFSTSFAERTRVRFGQCFLDKGYFAIFSKNHKFQQLLMPKMRSLTYTFAYITVTD